MAAATSLHITSLAYIGIPSLVTAQSGVANKDFPPSKYIVSFFFSEYSVHLIFLLLDSRVTLYATQLS